MNKNAIKKFAIEARKKLIDSVTDKAGMLGITEKSCSEPITKGPDFEVYQTVAGTEVTLNKRQCEQRRRLVSQIESRGFEAVVEEVAYTWFNRICAIRFMEVNDYLPNRVRVLSSEKEGKMEPDLVTQAPDVDLDLTAQEKEEIINWKMSGTSEDTDKLYCKLFLKQCHQLHDILPGLFEADSDYMELLFGISYTNKDDVIYMLVNPETGIPEADFNVSTLDEEGNPTGQVEIIGWLYQYYNTELKDDTFAKLKKNIKITKERIPAATQLFTPDWIVRYMVENSVGRIWIEHLRAVDPSTNEKTTAERFGWKYYLPEAEQEGSVNIKLAEIRTTYKDLKPTDITCIDPCMGSGHILIAMFEVLMDIYENAGYDKREAAFEIVEHNVHGLDIDQRAYQLAYFAVMMKGRGYNRRFLRGRDGKPEPKVYAIVESNDINRNHLQFFGTHLSEMERNLAVMQIEGLLDTFKDAREYGSILNVDAWFYSAYDCMEDADRFSQLRERIENIYSFTYLQKVTPKWNQELTDNLMEDTGLKRQEDFYRNYLKAYEGKNRVIVIISDAFRYECAKELMEQLEMDEKCTPKLECMISSLPSVTPVGMASLLPHEELQVDEKINVTVDGQGCGDLVSRDKILKAQNENNVALAFDELINANQSRLRELLQGKNIVYIYHNQIDARGDKPASENEIFRACEEAIKEIHRLVHRLTMYLSAPKFFITADHGFLYKRDKLQEYDKVAYDREICTCTNKRFLITKQRMADPGMRSRAMSYLKNSYVTTPIGADIFKVSGGGQNYVHGGSFLQEMLIPVVEVTTNTRYVEYDYVDVILTSVNRKVTNLITYFDFIQTEKVTDTMKARSLVAYFTTEDGEKISFDVPIVANSREEVPEKRTFHEKFTLKSREYKYGDKYYLVLADANDEKNILQQYEFMIDIAFVDDFGF